MDHSDTIAQAPVGKEPMNKSLICKVTEVSDLGLVFGWAIVCTEDGQPYVDFHNDYIPDESMLRASTRYAKGLRIAGDMHSCSDGNIIHTFPLTAQVAKSFGISCDKTGLMVAMEPKDQQTLMKFRTGERTGFSIGGRRITDTEITL